MLGDLVDEQVKQAHSLLLSGQYKMEPFGSVEGMEFLYYMSEYQVAKP